MNAHQLNKFNSGYPPRDSRTVLIPKDLRFLEDLLWEWVAIQERSIRFWEGKDALWWHNERVCVGGFAGAVWRSGGVVLEEYPTDKLRRDCAAAKTTRTVVGRGDMDFILGGRHFTIEAKHCWPRRGVKEVKNALLEAERDVTRCPAASDYIRLAIVFASPSMADESINSRLPEWIDQALSLEGCARAWVFPDLGRDLRFSWGKNNRIYPGAGLFVKRVDA